MDHVTTTRRFREKKHAALMQEIPATAAGRGEDVLDVRMVKLLIVSTVAAVLFGFSWFLLAL